MGKVSGDVGKWLKRSFECRAKIKECDVASFQVLQSAMEVIKENVEGINMDRPLEKSAMHYNRLIHFTWCASADPSPIHCGGNDLEA